MDTILVLCSLVLAAYAIRSICMKQQSLGKKVGKSIFSVWYFLTAGGLAVQPSANASASIIMMIIGAAVVWYCNRDYTKPHTKSKNLISEHSDALKDFELSNGTKGGAKAKAYRSVNYAKGKSEELKAVAFSYVNSKGESSFRDVDVKSFDGQYVGGYCHLSRKFKTFRLDRIDGDIIIRETGESLDVNDWSATIVRGSGF